MILVVGATGLVGTEVCRRLVEHGAPVRALVRDTSSPEKIAQLQQIGASIVRGDLRDPGSLERACRGSDAVITTVSSMPFSYVPGVNDIRTTDLNGQLALLIAAQATGVQHFTYTSFSGNLDRQCPLRDAKRALEKAVIQSGLDYTILRPSCFMEVWLSPAVGFDFPNAKATVYGDGTKPIAWIAADDVAEFAVQSIERDEARNAILELGGPMSLPALEAIATFERVSGRPFEKTFVPVEALDAQMAGADEPMAKSFATLMRMVADGDPIDMTGVLASIPVPLTSVEQYAARVLGKVPQAV